MNAEDEGGLDLSGDWDGMYSYPVPLAPVAFTAKLTEQAGSLSGFIEEDAAIGDDQMRRRLAASIEGRRLGLTVTFLKRYEDRAIHDDVEYDGRVSVDGAEISGRWSIFGKGSGPYLMVRRPRKAVARSRQTSSDTSA